MDEQSRVHFNRMKLGTSAPDWQFAPEHYKAYGKMPVEYAHICWDTEPEGQACNVTVAYVDRSIDNADARHRWFTYQCDSGNSWMDWPDERTPESEFAAIISLYGLRDEQEFYRALHEFGRIEQCDWARAMLHGMRYRIRELYDTGRLRQPGLIDQIEHEIDGGEGCE